MGCAQAKAKATAPPPPPWPPPCEETASSADDVKSGSSTPGSTEQRQRARASTRPIEETGTVLVLGKYKMNMSKEDVMGEGTSSICRKAVNVATGEHVAIKVYKSKAKDGAKQEDVKMQKFTRQINVLKELQQPFVEPSDVSLWNEQLARAKPSRLFMQLIDYSKDENGDPSPDTNDGVIYVVTELAQYSLKDYLALRRDQSKPLHKDSVKNITKAIILVMAGLHAKGLVHIDMKPENLMMFNGRLKLIDVDGCVRNGSRVSIQDSSISFSPCYCAPEWANFLIQDSESRIVVSPGLDVWSVGMTICELVTLDAVMKPMYASFLRSASSHREAGFLFMEWLGKLEKAPLPKSIAEFDPDFSDLLMSCLLVCDPEKRKSCADCLLHPYIQSAAGNSEIKRNSHSSTSSRSIVPGGVEHQPSLKEQDNRIPVDEQAVVVRTARNRREDTSTNMPVYKGILWKLNSDGNAKDAVHWLRRDMWVSSNGSLCYFSIKENKRLIMFDGSKLAAAKITRFEGGARDNAFQIATTTGENDAAVSVFAAETTRDYDEWMSKLTSAVNIDDVMRTMRLGGDMAQELKRFRVNVINRRMKVDQSDDKDQFAPLFKGRLWKVKAEGDRKKEEDWFEREMWLSKNGSLVYFSKKEDRDLVYYSADDIARASFAEIPNESSFRPWAFQVRLPPVNDVEFAPGEFAAESEALRRTWIAELERMQQKPANTQSRANRQ